MSQEQRDSYVIPPNFIEGGSFFGGLFKARNVVEAVILAAGTGLPILTLSLTLTVRIILLCLTSLPLALLALIGIAGMPLSSYIILFFRFLRNRRNLNKSGGKSSRKQAILPTWDKKSGPSTAVQPAAYKKDGSRIRFAKDTRRLMLDTAYRQKKQAERPGNPLAAYVPIQKIENGIVYTTDHRFIKILEIVPINFLLRSAREQRNIVYSFISYLKIAPVKLQIKVITKRADMNRHIETVRREMAQETNESCRMQQEDYLKLLKKLGSREAIARRFFLIMEYEPLPGAKKDREEADAISSLQTAARTTANYLRQCGNSVVQHENEDEAAAEMLYTFLCRRESTDVPFLQRISRITSNYIKAGCSIDEIPVGDFFAPSQLDFTHGSYGSWVSDSETQHKRTKTCSACGDSGYEYADHTDANGDGKCDDCGATVSLTVAWDAGSNGGTINGKASFSETVKPNSAPAAPSASPVKTGYTFKNWYTEKTGGKLYNTVTSITTSQTFYAQFTANTYTVTWNLGDGRSETTEQTYGEKLVLPTDPERKNAEFLGWFTEKDGGTEVTANTVFKETAATTYYAHWEITELFSVTVPATLPLVVDESGKVYVASASIVNNSTGDVMVSSVSVTSKNGWEFVPYSTNMAKAKVDAKQVGFKINSSETSKTGDSEVFTLAAPWTVKEADALSINYDAVVSAVSQPVTGQEIMSVVFVLEWA